MLWLRCCHIQSVGVFPTCVGMYRLYLIRSRNRNSFPHMRGDVPDMVLRDMTERQFSPHAWGCTDQELDVGSGEEVFPTCVGMYRPEDSEWTWKRSFPHIRGDVPVKPFSGGREI